MRRWIFSTVTAAALAALLAPGVADARRKQEKPKEAEVVKEGKITVVRGFGGGEPQFTDERNKRWMIVGPLRDEAVRLGGHMIKIWATVGIKKKMMMPTLEVKRYEILDSGGGRKPVVGILRHVKQVYMLERKEGNLRIEARSRSFFRRLARRVNCKIWIVGDLEGTTLKAFKFGWLNCKPPKALKPRKESTK